MAPTQAEEVKLANLNAEREQLDAQLKTIRPLAQVLPHREQQIRRKFDDALNTAVSLEQPGICDTWVYQQMA